MKPITVLCSDVDPDDLARIRTVLANHGYECSAEQASLLYVVWSNYGDDDKPAGWAILPDSDDDLFREMRRHFDESN